MLEQETLSELAAALNLLPQELRDIVVLLYYDRKPMTEIADLMHLSYGAVKLRHQKALTLLKRSLGA
jgi:RNA polymerase sigma-70 factor (ECF subfamily)